MWRAGEQQEMGIHFLTFYPCGASPDETHTHPVGYSAQQVIHLVTLLQSLIEEQTTLYTQEEPSMY